MSKVIFKAKPMQFKNGCLLLPATPADKIILDNFAQSCGARYCTVTANFSRSNKTYDQVKTVFALSSIMFQCQYFRKPSQEENYKYYRSLLDDYAPREPDIRNPEKEVAKSLESMSKSEAAQFINNLIGILVEYCDLTPEQQVDVRGIFQEFKKETMTGNGNPVDYDPNGHEYTIDEWCEVNNISMASGVNDGTLEIAHIITKSKRPDIRNCTWNFLRLTHYEHLEIQHRKGWQELLNIYPHLLPRVKSAYDRAGELYPFTMQEKFDKYDSENQKELKEGNKEKSEENFPNFNTMQPISTEDLADQALEDIF